MFYAFFWVIPRRLIFTRRGITQKKAYKKNSLYFSKMIDKCTSCGRSCYAVRYAKNNVVLAAENNEELVQMKCYVKIQMKY